MYTILSLIGIGSVAYNFDKIKIFYLQQMGNYRATEITINFFVELLKENKDINLPDAILKFEDPDGAYKSLDEYSAARFRPYDSYIAAYYDLFEAAKKRLY